MTEADLEQAITRVVDRAMRQGRMCEHEERRRIIRDIATKAILNIVQRWDRGGGE